MIFSKDGTDLTIYIKMDLTKLMVSLALLGHVAHVTRAHPQCLDSQPPFTVSTSNTFCGNYTDFGCCTKDRYDEVWIQYNNTNAQLITIGLAPNCSGYLQDLLCQECSPYAAHVFGFESDLQRSALPGLCTDYCSNLYTQCKDIIVNVTSDTTVLDSLRSKDDFCNLVKLPDTTYCFPDLLSNLDLNKDLDRERRTKPGCLCLQEFARD